MELQDLVPISKAAKKTDLSENTIRRRLRSGQIKGRQIGRDWFVDADEVERLSRQYPVAV